MSYSIYIGEAVIDNEDDETGATKLSVRVRKEALRMAPVFVGDEMTGNTNGRHPGYGQWAEFCRDVGLYDLFFSKENGLMRDHPGCFELSEAHLKMVKDAITEWKKTHKKEPGWDDPLPKSASPEEQWEHERKMNNEGCKQRDPTLARLLWLAWWMSWALQKCKLPAIYNS